MTDDSDSGDSFDALLREAAAAPSRPVRAPGTVLAGRYRLDRLLGEGGMGIVWAATHTVTRQRVALKLMHASGSSRAALRKRFLLEARAAAAIDHPNVVPVRDVFELDDGELVMVMELLEGETLQAKLDRHGPLSLRETADLLLPAVSAVGTAHAEGIVHRDLKPGNLVISGDPPSAKVLDFGLAKLLPDGLVSAGVSTVTETGQPLGTPCYMAPEQALGEPDVDQRADVWSFGAIVYECLTGKRFVDAESFGRVVQRLSQPMPPPTASAPDLPDEVGELLDRMLRVERESRPGDLRPLFDALTAHATRPAPPFGTAPTVPAPNAEAPPPREARSNSRTWAFSTVALVALGGFVVWQSSGAEESPHREGVNASHPAAAPVASPLPTAPEPLAPASSSEPAGLHAASSAPSDISASVLDDPSEPGVRPIASGASARPARAVSAAGSKGGPSSHRAPQSTDRAAAEPTAEPPGLIEEAPF